MIKPRFNRFSVRKVEKSKGKIKDTKRKER
jgi:hypothetical protein